MLSRFFNLDSRLLKHASWVYAIVLIGWGLWYFITPANVSLFNPDTESYINFSPIRTMGYPVFLWLVHKLTGGYGAVFPIQLFIFVFSLGFAALAFARFMRSFTVGLFLIAGIMALPQIVGYTAQVFTESLTASLIMLLAGAILNHARRQRACNLWLVGFVLGLLILIRPSAYSFLIIVPFLLFFYRGAFIRNGVSITIPLVLCILIGSTFNYIKHGFFSTQSFLGNNLYGKMLFVVRPGMKGETPLQTQLIEYMFERQRPFRETLEEIHSDQPLFFSIVSPLYDKFRFEMFAQACEQFPEIKKLADVDRFCRDLSFAIMRQNPTSYLEDVLLNYRALWFTWDLRTPEKEDELKHVIDTYKKLPHFKAVGLDYNYVKIHHYPAFFVYAFQAFLVLSFIISLYFIAVFFLRPFTLCAINHMGLLFSLMIHSHFLTTALVQAGLPRYTLIVRSLMFMMNILFAYDMAQRLAGYKKHQPMAMPTAA